MSETGSRVLRTSMQLIAGGALTAFVDVFARQLSAQESAMLMATMTLLVTFCHNYAEDAGWIQPVLKGDRTE